MANDPSTTERYLLVCPTGHVIVLATTLNQLLQMEDDEIVLYEPCEIIALNDRSRSVLTVDDEQREELSTFVGLPVPIMGSAALDAKHTGRWPTTVFRGDPR